MKRIIFGFIFLFILSGCVSSLDSLIQQVVPEKENIFLPDDPFIVYSFGRAGLWGGSSTTVFSSGLVEEKMTNRLDINERKVKYFMSDDIKGLIQTVYLTGVTDKTCKAKVMFFDDYYFGSAATPEKKVTFDGYETGCESEFVTIQAKFQEIYDRTPAFEEPKQIDSNVLMPPIQEIDTNVDSALIDLGPVPTFNNDYYCNVIDSPVKIKNGVFTFKNNVCGVRYELQNKQSPSFFYEGPGPEEPIYRISFSSECEVLENELSAIQKQSFSTDKLFIDGQGKLYFCELMGRG